MPEATVDEDDGFVFRQDDVGLARKILSLDAKTEPLCMEDGAEQEFRFGVLAFDAGHHPAALFSGNNIHFVEEIVYPRMLLYHPK